MATPTTTASEDLNTLLATDRNFAAALPDIAITPIIVAGAPSLDDPAEADSPELRIDPNLATSPFAGVGSINVRAPGIGDFLCSGTAISPRHILTAAHCLDVEGEDGIIDVTPSNVTFNINAQGESAAPIAITAAALNIFDTGSDRYEGFSNTVNNDLAIITLSEDLPVGIPIYELSREPLAERSLITLVGYGTTGNGIDGHLSGTADATIKRVGKNEVDDASAFEFLIPNINEVFVYDFDGPDASTNTLGALGSGLTLGNQVETTVGPGDSGGPSFMQVGDEWLLVGVNTFGFAFPDLEAPTTEVIQGTFGTGGGGVILADPEKLAWIESIVGDDLGAGVSELGSLAGIVWHDLDGDGDRTSLEPVLPGWQIYLDLNNNNLLDEAEPTTLTDETGAYQFAELTPGSYTVAAATLPAWQQTAPLAGNAERFKADFSDGDVPSLDGFVIDNSGAPVPGLWHLSTARGNQPGHSPLHSLYFGQDETAEGDGNYDVGHTAGRVTSPEIDLTGLERAELTFSYFLNVEPDFMGDRPRVRITTDGNTFETIAEKEGELRVLPSQADSWITVNLSLNEFVGNVIQVQFDFDTVDEFVNNLEGWFVDDVVVQGLGSTNHRVTLNPGQDLAGLNFGQQHVEFNPPSNPAESEVALIGLFDYEQYLRYRSGAIAAIPTETIDNLPLVQFFDEAFYLRHNPDVAAAVAAGRQASGYRHFVNYGLAEGRNPSLLYSEAYYLQNNPDVARAVDADIFQSGLEHFLNYGHAEVRDPSAYFDQADYLALNADVTRAVSNGRLQSAFEHYIKYGADEENRLPATAAAVASLYQEAFYLRTNPEVDEAIAQGVYVDGFDHFIQIGQGENRNPSGQLNLEGYLAANPDVQSAVDRDVFASAFDHYVQFGRFENRSLA